MRNNKESQENSQLSHLLRMNELNSLLETEPNDYASLLKEYISIYIENNKHSQEIFVYLCEHKFMSKLFKPAKSQVSHLQTLELFNLLLANTTEPPHLVYIFSQSVVHEYLFADFPLDEVDSQCLEYYIQLIKTIIMKVSTPKSTSIIKLFCNARYNSFPLLGVIVKIAVKRTSQNDLAVVTAQQCLLILIGLIKDKDVGVGYLCEIEMVVFYYQICYEIVSHVSNQQGQGSNELLKFLSDLVVTLHPNQVSLSMLLSCLLNHLLIAHSLTPHKVLEFLYQFRQNFNHLELAWVCEQIMTVLYRVVAKIFFNVFVNCTYLSFINRYIENGVKEKQKIEQPNLGKIIKEYYEKVGEFLVGSDLSNDTFTTSKEKEIALEQFRHYNQTTTDIQTLKQSPKKSKTFFSMIKSKIISNSQNSPQNYLRQVYTIAGLKYDLTQPTHKLSIKANFQSNLYLVQQLSYKLMGKGQIRIEKGQKQQELLQSYYNDRKGKIKLEASFMTEVVKIIDLLKRHHLPLYLTKLNPQKLAGQYYFLQKLRSYLLSCSSDHFLTDHQLQTLESLRLFHYICSQVSIYGNLQKINKQRMMENLECLQKNIQDMTFEGDLKYIVEYLTDHKGEDFLEGKKNKKKKKDKQLQSFQKSDKKKKYRIWSYIFMYEIIKKMISNDNELSTLHEYFTQKWNTRIMNTKEPLISCNFTIYIYENSSCIMTINPLPTFSFMVTISLYSEILKQFILCPSDPQIIQQKDDEISFRFANLKDKVRLVDDKQSNRFVNQFRKVKANVEQIITMCLIQYLEFSYEGLCGRVFTKGKIKQNSEKQIQTPF